jgi:hypothetical protein
VEQSLLIRASIVKNDFMCLPIKYFHIGKFKKKFTDFFPDNAQKGSFKNSVFAQLKLVRYFLV